MEIHRGKGKGNKMKYFTLNGKEYKSKELDYNTACDLEDMGVSLEMANTRPMSMVRAYFACCADISKEAAGKEIEAHIVAGGKLDDVIDIMTEEVENSSFFRALNKTAETEDAENTSEQGKEEKKERNKN